MKSLLLTIIFTIFSLCIYSQASSEKLIRRGVSMHDKGRYNDAIAYYEQALKVQPTSMSATYEMSLSYLRLKDYNNALKYSTKVINANFRPLLIDAYCVKSSALTELNKVDEAIKLLNDAIKKNSDEYLLHYNLGLSYYKIKNTNLAMSHFKKAIEIDTTQPNAFLLYAYTLNDSEKWLQSFLSFHFFLFLEPNTNRSKEAFSEMYEMLVSDKLSNVQFEDNIDRSKLYEYIKLNKPKSNNKEAQFLFFRDVTKRAILMLNQAQSDSKKGILWDFYIPIYSEILGSGYIDVYCKYVSASYFPESLKWWANNKKEVDSFISWFEEEQIGEQEEDSDEYGDDSEEAK